MHYAKIENSPRLQRALKTLKSRWDYVDDEYAWWSTRELIDYSHICAVNSAISELRANGYDIECKCITKGLYWYRLRE
jgi:hypothetical protein